MIGDCEATISPSATKGPAEPGLLGVSDQEPTTSIHEEFTCNTYTTKGGEERSDLREIRNLKHHVQSSIVTSW